MWSKCSKNGHLFADEGMGAFWLYNRLVEPPVEACIGDGVDMFTNSDGQPIPVATPDFYQTLENLLDNAEEELLQAYFPHKEVITSG